MSSSTLSSSSKIRWGFISCGKITHDFVLALQYLPDVDLVACAARDATSAQSFASTFAIPHHYASYEDMLKKHPEIDIIYVGSIHPFHFEHALLTLKYKKHLLVEKPLVMNATQVSQLMEESQKQQRFCMEAVWSRFLPSWLTVLEWIQSKKIGKIKLVTADFGVKFPDEKTVPRVWKKELGGGSLLDLGVYTLNCAFMAFGDKTPQKILAVGDINEHGVDTHLAVSLKFGDGELASLVTSNHLDSRRDAVISGENGYIILHGPFFHCTDKVTLKVDGQPPITVESTLEPLPNQVYNFPCSQNLKFQAEHVHKCLREGLLQSPLHPLTNTLQIMKCMDEIRKQVGVVYPDDKL